MWRIALLIIIALTITLPVHAKPNKAHKQGKQVSKQAVEQGTFSPAERNLIRSHLLGNQGKAKQKNLPPGLQKKVARGKSLPPGWQKKVAPGYSLDYQVYRQGVSLPDILLQRLPPSPVGSEIIQVHDKIIRLNAATRTILDVFNLVPRQ
jgi:hypothetical protein